MVSGMIVVVGFVFVGYVVMGILLEYLLVVVIMVVLLSLLIVKFIMLEIEKVDNNVEFFIECEDVNVIDVVVCGVFEGM